jgi:pimeloyl-ACP methyl ester carboxylesterase
LILFDTRGMGLSDPIANPAPLEEWMDDVRAVMDAVGSERAALVGHGHGGQLGLVFAAAHPERTHALVTINSFARLARAPDYRPGMPENVQRLALDQILQDWGTGRSLALLAPTVAHDDRAVQWWASLAFTDIFGSTELAAELGDARWRELIETHDSVADREITAARGRLVKSTGDGVLATFEDDIGGIAVHIASRVAALAERDEVLVSSTVKDLVAGSGLTFADRGAHALRGVPGEWRVFALAS